LLEAAEVTASFFICYLVIVRFCNLILILGGTWSIEPETRSNF
jgi:hypothetical protein